MTKACPSCQGAGALLGALGRTKHFRCVSCGWTFSHTPRRAAPKKPEGGVWNKDYTNGVIGAGWLVSYDFPDFEFVTRLAASASKLDGQDWIPVDKGPSVSPRYDVMVCPKVGDDVSKSFNGDYYPAGKVVAVSAGPVRRVITVDGPMERLRFYRRGLSAGWVQAGGTWSLVKGIHKAWNREF